MAPKVVFPLGEAKRVAISYDVCFGSARDGPTRVPTSALAACAEANSPEEVARWYDVPLEAVKCAIEFETRKRKEPELRRIEEAARNEARLFWLARGQKSIEESQEYG